MRVLRAFGRKLRREREEARERFVGGDDGLGRRPVVERDDGRDGLLRFAREPRDERTRSGATEIEDPQRVGRKADLGELRGGGLGFTDTSSRRTSGSVALPAIGSTDEMSVGFM